VRLPNGPQPSADRRLGTPKRAAMLRYPSPRDLAARALPIASVLSGRRRHQLGRLQDLCGRAVMAAGPPGGHGVGTDAARCGCGRSRTAGAHPDTADRAYPRPAGSARPAGGSPRRSQRMSPFTPASIAYHTPLAAAAGWYCREPTLTVPRH
jgi:hypothetical protein